RSPARGERSEPFSLSCPSGVVPLSVVFVDLPSEATPPHFYIVSKTRPCPTDTGATDRIANSGTAEGEVRPGRNGATAPDTARRLARSISGGTRIWAGQCSEPSAGT